VTYLEAAIAVLKGAKRPLTVAEITNKALQSQLIRPTGRTPTATMSATLYTHVRDNPRGGVQRLYLPGELRAKRDSVRWRYARG
jgi:hypothetical protein